MKNKKDAGRKVLLQLSQTLYADQVTYDKVHRHLRDINDTITEQDIENVRTDIVFVQQYQTVETKIFEEGKKITSTWNIVSE